MCKGSAYVLHQSDAQPGESYCVSNAGTDTFPIAVLHLAGHGARGKDGLIQCAACIKVPTAVQITNVPVKVQEFYGTGPTIRGIFEPGNDHQLDYIYLENGTRIAFNHLIEEDVRLELRPMSETAPVVEADSRRLELA